MGTSEFFDILNKQCNDLNICIKKKKTREKGFVAYLFFEFTLKQPYCL
jgi:hypothetical protein